MFCMHCGTALPEGAAFCPACGAETGIPGSTPPVICASCGSRALKRVRKGEYVCEFCGSRSYGSGEGEPKSPEAAEAELAALFAEASEYEQRDDIPAELRILVKGLDFAPENCSLLLKLGRAYWRLGQNRKALEYYRKAEQADPADPIVCVNTGNVWLVQGKYAKAKALYEKGLAIIEADPLSASPNDVAVSYGNYGNCLGKMGDLKGARKYLAVAKAKGYDPQSLANVCRQLGIDPDSL